MQTGITYCADQVYLLCNEVYTTGRRQLPVV